LALDVDDADEKRLVREGTFANKSSRIRVVMSDDVKRGEVPDEALPFGFKGIPSLRTTGDGKDGNHNSTSYLRGLNGGAALDLGTDGANELGFSILPPLPYRMKVTRGAMTNSGDFFQTYLGQSRAENLTKITSENVKLSMYWGLLNTRVEEITDPNRATDSSQYSRLTENLCKFLGADEDLLFSGADADAFNNNKFSLAKVSFPRKHVKDITGSPSEAFLEAVYVRNADVGDANGIYDAATHTINMGSSIDPFNFEDAIVEGDYKASYEVIVG
jgi:hypothetical protein